MSDKITKKLYDDIHNIMVEAAATMPKNEKEKSLAALATPKDKVTHKDVLVGRGVIAKEETELEEGRFKKGEDVGKPGMNFAKIAKSAAARYGSKAAGERVAGAVLKKVLAKEEAEQVQEDHDLSLDEIPLEDLEAFMQTEDYEQLDELSKTTLGSYIKKRSHDVATQGAVTRQFAVNAAKEKEAQGGYSTRSVRDLEDRTNRAFAKGWKHRQNIGKAVDRLTKEGAESHQAMTTMKHINNPTAGEKKAAKDIKPGVAGYRDRVAMLKSAEARGALKKEEAELTYEDYAMAILTLGGYDSFGDIDKEDMQDVMEAIDNAYYADDVEVFVRAFSQNNQEE